MASRKKKRVVAITGVRTFLGARLARALEGDPNVKDIVAIDLDLTAPDVTPAIQQALRGVDTLVHAAFVASPSHDENASHELDTIGTMHVLDALSAAKTKKLIFCSTAMCYGARPENPSYLDESQPLAADGERVPRFIADKVEAERQAQLFANEHEDRIVTVLRPATVIGPTVESYATRNGSLVGGEATYSNFRQFATSARIIR